MRRVHLWIVGAVQGVFFRASCAERARALSLAGWARNLADGQVEVVAEGNPVAIEALVEWCHQGPPLARVEHVSVRWEEPVGEAGFRVLD